MNTSPSNTDHVYDPPPMHPLPSQPAPLPPYPTFKVVCAYTFAPALVALVLIAKLAILQREPNALFTLSLMAVFFAQVFYGIPALITGAIIANRRLKKDTTGCGVAMLIGGLCAGLPTMVWSNSGDFDWVFMTKVAAIASLVLAVLVLPKPPAPECANADN